MTLAPAIQISLHDGTINEKTAHELLLLTPEDQTTLHTLFTNLQLGNGKQNRLLSLSKDAAYRDNKTITELLSSQDYRNILEHQDMNSPQKIANILTTLHNKLFPQSHSAEDAFRRKVKEMNLPDTCTIAHSPAFERNDISVTLQFADMVEVEKRVPTIKNLLKH